MCCSQMQFVSWKLTADAGSGFSVKVQTMVIFTPVFCKFAFLKFFAIGTDCIRMQIGKPKKEVYIKMQKNKKQSCRIAAKVCLYMNPLSLLLCCFFRYGEKNYYFSKRCFPCVLPAFRLASFLSLLAFAPFVFPWLSPLLQPTKFIEGYLQEKPVVKISFLQEIKSLWDIL